MAKFEIGDIVWAKMKGFPAWPGKLIEPKPDVKKAPKKNMQFIFFFGSDNYAWVQEENLSDYVENKGKFIPEKRIPSGLPEAVKAADNAQAVKPKKARKISTGTPKTVKRSPSGSGTKRPLTDSASSAKRPRMLVKMPPVARRSPTAPQESLSKAAVERIAADFTAIGAEAEDFNDADTSLLTTDTSDVNLSSQSDADYTTVKARKNLVATPFKIGFLGLGAMGNGIVKNLLNSGHEVTVWNRTPLKCRDFVSDRGGARKGNSPEEVVRACDITFCCVSDPEAVREVVTGSCGVLESMCDNKGFVDLGTVDPDTVFTVQEAIASRGGRYLGAPVIGSKDTAAAAELIVIAAGDRSLYDDCYSCFDAISTKTIFMGDVADLAMKMKLVLSMFQGTLLCALAESLSLADKVGLNSENVLELIKHTPMSSSLISSRGTAMITSQHETHFALEHQQKDMRLGVNMADQVDLALHVGGAANELFKRAKSRSLHMHDVAAIFQVANM